MNILFVSDDNLAQSVVFDIHLLAESLSLRGHNVSVVCSRRGEKPRLQTQKSKLKRAYSNSKAELITFGNIGVPYVRFFFSIINGYRVLKKTIIEKKIDIIVLYSVLITGVSASRLSKKFNIPIIFRSIDMLHRLQASQFKKFLIKFCEKRVYQQVYKLLALTPNYAEYLTSLGADKKNIELLYFPLNFDIFNDNINTVDLKKLWNLAPNDKPIVFIGHLYSFNGLVEFIKEFPMVVSAEPNVKLMIVGDGPLQSLIREEVAALGLGNHVILTGFQPFHDIPAYINLAKVCINCYPLNNDKMDLFCAKVLQYMACGKATVSSALPGLINSISSSQSGIIYVDNAKDMASQVLCLLQSTVQQELLGKRGMEFVRNLYDSAKVVSDLEGYLQQVCRTV